MDAKVRFHQLMKEKFFPLLRADGYKGSGTTLRRLKGERIDVINIQGSKWRGECFVNLSVHYTFLPNTAGELPDPKTIKEYECEFRERLTEENESDHSWSYGLSGSEAVTNVASLVDLFQRRGTSFFGYFEPFPDVFDRIEPEDVAADETPNTPVRMNRVRAALTLARIMKHLGNFEKCRAFAEVGLRHLGRAVALKEDLERLRDVQ